MTRASRTDPPPDIRRDERDNFPAFFFNATCQCKEHFMGHNCGFCAFGWTGDRCDIPKTIHRKNLVNLNEDERESYMSTLHVCKVKIDPICVILRTTDRFRERSMTFLDASYYDVAAAAHNYAAVPFVSNGREITITNYAHGSSAFPCWHRLWLLFFEWQMQRCSGNEDFGVAYWEWENDEDCEVCNNKFFGSNSNHGGIDPFSPFSIWRLACPINYPNTVCVMDECPCERPKLTRTAGLSGYVKATMSDVYRCKNMTNYDTPPWGRSASGFRNCIEGLHDGVHVYCGGTMSLVAIAANDGLFASHHANVDRIVSEYYEYYGMTPESYPTDNNVYGHTAYTCLVPFPNCWRVKDMMGPAINYGTVYD